MMFVTIVIPVKLPEHVIEITSKLVRSNGISSMQRGQTAGSIVHQIISREVSGVEIVKDALARAHYVQGICNAFTILLDDEALQQAKALDDALAAGHAPGLLHGVPIAIKDMTPTKGHPTTLGSWTSGDGITDHDAVIVQRLKQAGAIIIGKTTTAEFAFSSFTKSLRYGPTLNPWNLERTAGGSSGGSAVAVATAAVPLAEGTDMGGSVRIPAGACGTVGFKPSLGRIPMTIVPSALETYSHFGPLARSVSDAARFVAATAGHHPADMLSLTTDFSLDDTHPDSLEGKRFALSMDLGYCDLHRDVEAGVEAVAKKLIEVGAIVEPVELGWTREVFDQWAIRWNSFLGLLPNSQSEENLAKMNPELAASIRAGRAASAEELIGVEVFRTQMNHDLISVFEHYDALICPTNAIPAPPVTDNDSDYENVLPNGKLRAFDMAHPFNMVPTCPAISLPVGRASDGLPIGMQVVGGAHQNEKILALAGAIEALLEPLPIPKI